MKRKESAKWVRDLHNSASSLPANGPFYSPAPDQSTTDDSGGRKIGTFGVAAAWSFFGNKNLTTGEGGMVTRDNEEVAQRVRILRSHAMTTLTYDRHRGHAAGYDVVATGYNHRMDEVREAIGREQLKKLPQANGRRRDAATRLRAALEPLREKGLAIPFPTHHGVSAHHLFVVLLPPGMDRDRFRQRLQADGIQTLVHYSLWVLGLFQVLGVSGSGPIPRFCVVSSGGAQ